MQKIIGHYFESRNYLLIYLNAVGDRFVNAIVEIFVGAFLFHLGMPLYLVILFFGLEFGFRALFAPLGMIFLARFGLGKTLIISYSSFALFFVFIGFAQVSLIVGFCAFIFQSFARGLYYPIWDGVHSVAVGDGSRGKQLTLEIVISSLAAIAGVSVVTVMLDRVSFAWIVALVILMLGVAVIPTFFIRGLSSIPQMKYKNVYSYLASREHRNNITPISAYSIAILANIILVPIYIYTVVSEFSVLGIIMVTAITVETIITLLYGELLDRFGNVRMLRLAAGMTIIGNLGMIFFVKNVLGAFAINTFNKISWNMLHSNFVTRVQHKGKLLEKPFLFGAVLQMNLCFTQVITMSLFAFVAYFISEWVFILVFLSSIVAIVFYERYFTDKIVS